MLLLQPLVTTGCGYLPTGYLPTGYLPTGYLPIGAAATGGGSLRGKSAASATLSMATSPAVSLARDKPSATSVRGSHTLRNRSMTPQPLRKLRRGSYADPAKVEAKFDKGVLHIHLPKPAEAAQKQQKIEIKKG